MKSFVKKEKFSSSIDPNVAYSNRQKSLRSSDSAPSANVLASDRISRTGSSTVHPVPACARPHLTHSDAFFLGVGM